MNRKITAILCVAASMLTLSACNRGSGVDAAAVGDEMKRGTREWIAAYNAGDIDAVLGKFAPDAVVMPPQSPATAGSEEIRKLWTEGSASIREAGLAVRIGDDDDVGVSGDVGWHTGSYAYTSTAGPDQPGGHFMQVWENRDGKWLVVRIMWNEGQPPPEPEAPSAPPPVAPAS